MVGSDFAKKMQRQVQFLATDNPHTWNDGRLGCDEVVLGLIRERNSDKERGMVVSRISAACSFFGNEPHVTYSRLLLGVNDAKTIAAIVRHAGRAMQHVGYRIWFIRWLNFVCHS